MSSNKNIFSFPLDVTDFDECQKVFEKILKEFSDVDIYFFCSGTMIKKKRKV